MNKINDLISRQAAIDALHMHLMYRMGTDSNKKRLDDWINSLPSAQETHEELTETHACDCISRQAAIDALCAVCGKACDKSKFVYNAPQDEQVILCPEHYCLCTLPSAQPEIIHCCECQHWKQGELVDKCGLLDCYADADCYCAWAARERRQDEQTD